MSGGGARVPLQAASVAGAYRFWIDEHVRFADLDVLGHVNNVAFTAYVENARAAFLREIGLWVLNAPRQNVIARLEMDYRHELHYPALMRVGINVLRVGRSSFALGTGVFSADRCVASAATVQVRIDTQSRQPVPLSEDERARLLAHLWQPIS